MSDVSLWYIPNQDRPGHRGDTTRFEPLVAIRPGYWRPAHFAASAATLGHLTGGPVRVNVVSGLDDLAAYGDREGDQAQLHAGTAEFMRVVRRLWLEGAVTDRGEHFQADLSLGRAPCGMIRTRPSTSPWRSPSRADGPRRPATSPWR